MAGSDLRPAQPATGSAAQSGKEDVVIIGHGSDRSNDGLLGDVVVQDTPFSISAYKAELLVRQQARTVRDAVANDASVRVSTSEGAVGEQFLIRGFPLGNQEISTDGLFGLVNSRRTPLEFYDRVEVLKGPNGLFTGTPPTGNVGGVINLVTKQAPERSVTRMTGSYASDSYFGGHVDLARRFGHADQFGARINVVYRDGGLPFGFETNRLFGLSGTADFRSGPLRIFAYGSHTDDRTTAPNVALTFADVVLPAPDGNTNPSQPWVYFASRYTGGYAGAALELAEGWSIQARYGHANTFDRSFATINATAVRANGSFDFLPNIFSGRSNVDTYDATLIGHVRTGAVSHRLSLATNAYSAELFGARVTPLGAVLLPASIYRPVFYPEPMLPRTGDYRRSGENRLTSYAVADTLGGFDDRLLVTLGARYQRLHVISRNIATQEISSESNRSRLSPTAALLFKANGALSLYASHTTALTPGPIPSRATCNFGQLFPPLLSRQYEAGAKAAFGRLAAQVAVFEITNRFSILGPIQLRLPPCQTLAVDGRVRNRGLEATMSGSPMASVQVVGGLSLYDGRLIRTSGGLYNGNRAPGIPHLQLNLSGEWTPAFAHGLAFNARVTSTAGVQANAANTQGAPGWTIMDLGLAYRLVGSNVPVTFRAAVLNVADDDYYAAAANGSFLRGAPRTARMSISVDL